MHIIRVSVITFLQLKCSFLMCLKKGLLTELEKRKKRRKKRFSERQYNFWVGPMLGGSVGARQTNIVLRSALEQ